MTEPHDPYPPDTLVTVCGMPLPVEVQLAVAAGPVVQWPPGMPLPRAGERVQLEDGTSTWVRRVNFTLGESPIVVITAGPLEAYPGAT